MFCLSMFSHGPLKILECENTKYTERQKTTRKIVMLKFDFWF